MLQGRIYKLIKEKIGDYLYGFKEDQLKIGIFSGQVKLENVTLKHDKLNQNPTLQASPIAIKAGMLGLLQINIKYTDLYHVDVLIEDVYLVLGPNFSHLRKRDDYKNNEEKFLELGSKLEKLGGRLDALEPRENNKAGKDEPNLSQLLDPKYEIDQIYQKKLRGEKIDLEKDDEKTKHERYDLNKPPKTNENNPLIKALLHSEFLKNQRVTINRIHIRYEDDQVTYKGPIAMGLMISNIKISPNEEIEIGIPVHSETPHFGYYSTEKKLVDNLIQDILEQPNSRAISYQVTVSNVESYLSTKSEMYIPYSLYENTMQSPHGIFEAMPPLEMKNLMFTYFKNAKHYKHPLFRIEQIKVQTLVAIRQHVSKNWCQYVLTKTEANNITIELKPDILQDTIDLINFYKHFKTRKLLDRFKPEVRPILNKKIYSASHQTEFLKKEVTREWWRLVLWFHKIKKIAGKEELVDKLYEEFKKRSPLKKLCDYKDYKKIFIEDKENWGKKKVTQSGLKASEPLSSRNIFQGVPPKEELPQREDENYKRFKLPYLYAFFEAKRINFNIRKPNMKAFLSLRLDYIHLNALANIDFRQNHSITFQMSSSRVIYYYNDAPKQIFDENPKKYARDSEYPSRDQSQILNNPPDFGTVTPKAGKIFGNVQSSIREAQNSIRGAQSSIRGTHFKMQSYDITLGNQVIDRTGRQEAFSVISERPTARSRSLMRTKTPMTPTANTDILLLELKDDIIFKFNYKKIDEMARSLQLRSEVGEIEVKLENAVFKDLFDYFSDLRQNYSVRHMSTKVKLEFRNTFYNMEKQVILADSPDKRAQESPPKGSVLEDFNNKSLKNSQLLNVSRAESAYMDFFKSHYQSYLNGAQMKSPESIIADLVSPDPTNLFLRKLTHFFQLNEVMVSININGVFLSVSETTPQTVEKVPLLTLSFPKGRIFLSLNYNRKSLNVVEVFGIKMETASKFQAIYSFFKKIRNMVKMGIEINRDPNTKFYELVKKGKNLTPEELEFKKLYAASTDVSKVRR